MSPFPTPCKGKSKSQPFAHTFALTGRRRLYTDTQGVALGCELAALSGRSFSRFVRLSCAHASPLVVWQKNAQRIFFILNTLPFRGSCAARTLGEGLKRSIVAHFASKVSNNAGTATDVFEERRKTGKPHLADFPRSL